MTQRTDIHRPSAINPADYEFVAHDYIGPNGGMWKFLADERDRFNIHRARTGGTFSDHAHGGSCHVCGASAFYIAKFYHAKTNAYIVTGEDCAEKMHLGNPAAFRIFRDKVHSWQKIEKGRELARQYLERINCAKAWEVYESEDRGGFEEHTIRDIVSKIVHYGSVSERAGNYIHVLLDKIAARRGREPETTVSAPVPVTEARIEITGTVISTKIVDSPYGPQLKMLVKADEGFKVYGTVPSAIRPVNKGDRVSFEAGVQVSKDDKTFGFFNRPSNAILVEAAS